VHNTSLDEAAPTRLELALSHDRASLIVLLILLPLVCWAWIVVMARDMYGPMTGASAWMMTLRWDAPHVLLLWAMWVVMMVGMMLPSAAPLVLMYGVASRRRGAGALATSRIYALAAGYVTVWALFSVVATASQRILSAWFIVSPMMTLTRPAVGAGCCSLPGSTN
jgi:predicted metal-binding membrane protein